MTRAFFVLLIGVLVILPASGSAIAGSALEDIRARGQLRVGFEAGYMPFQMIDRRAGLRQRYLPPGDIRRGGQRASFIGFDIDLARLMARELGVDYVPVPLFWTDLIPALRLGRIDVIVSGMSVTPERQARVDFGNPYFTVGQTVLLAAAHKDAVTSYRQLDDPAFVVASKPGTTGEAAVARHLPKARYRPFKTEFAGATAVATGKADAFVYDGPYNRFFMAIHGGERLVLLDQPFTREDIAFAVRKGEPELLEGLNAFLAEIKADGRLDAIHERWFENTDWFARVQ